MLRLCLLKSIAVVAHLGRFNHCLRDLVMGLWILESVQAGSGFTASENWSEGSR